MLRQKYVKIMRTDERGIGTSDLLWQNLLK